MCIRDSYNAIGICGFGAESTLDGNGRLTEASQKVADTMEIIRSMSPMLQKYGGTEKIFCVTQEEFQKLAYVKRKLYHITFYFTTLNEKGRPLGKNLRVCGKPVSYTHLYFIHLLCPRCFLLYMVF